MLLYVVEQSLIQYRVLVHNISMCRLCSIIFYAVLPLYMPEKMSVYIIMSLIVHLSVRPSACLQFSYPVCIFSTDGRKLKLLGRNVRHNGTICRAERRFDLSQVNANITLCHFVSISKLCDISVSFEPIERNLNLRQKYYS
jgi:hypothetical protein